jgi:transposase
MARGYDVPELGKGKTMTKNGNLVKGIVAALMMVGVVACTVTDSPPQDLVAKNDHAGLETWYVKEAAHLRKRTKDMMAMTERYQKNPGPNTPGAVSANFVLVQHCQALAASYAKAADEADEMARAHRDMTGR